MKTFNDLNDDEKIRVKAIVDLQNEILKSIIDVMTDIKNESQSISVVATSFIMIIRELDKMLNGNFLPIILELLNSEDTEKSFLH